MSTKIDLSEFAKYASKRTKKPCQIGFVYPQLDVGEQEQLQAAFKEYPDGAIAEWLSVRGHDVSIPALTSHRRGRCTCGH